MRRLRQYVYAQLPDIDAFLREKREIVSALGDLSVEEIIRSPQTIHLIERANKFIARWNPSANIISPEYIVYEGADIDVAEKWKIVRYRFTSIQNGMYNTLCDMSLDFSGLVRASTYTFSMRNKNVLIKLGLFGTVYSYKMQYGEHCLYEGNGYMHDGYALRLGQCDFLTPPFSVEADSISFIGCRLIFRRQTCINCTYHSCENTLHIDHKMTLPASSACHAANAMYLYARRREIMQKTMRFISENREKISASYPDTFVVKDFL